MDINDPNQLISRVYPEDINSTHHYVFFSSLFHKNPPGPEIAQLASDYLNSTKLMTKDPVNSVTIDNVLSFLDTIIANEYSKEVAFLQYLSKVKNIKLDIPNLNGDWSDFIGEVQNITQIGQTGLTNLKLEYERLSNNVEHVNQAHTKYTKGEITFEELQKSALSYQRSTHYNTTQQLKKVISFLSGDGNATGKAVINYILKHHGDKLLVFKNGELALNQSELVNTIVGISHIIIERYNTIKDSIPQESKKNRYKIDTNLEELLEKDTQLDTDINNMLNLDNLPFVTNTMMKSYQLKTSNRTNKDFTKISNIIQERAETNEQLLLTADELQQYFSQRHLQDEITLKLVSNKNAMSEVREVTIGALQGAFHGTAIGNVGAKTDELLAFLDINFPNLKDGQLQKVRSTMEKISSKLTMLESGFKQTNTFEYYEQRQTDWNNALKAIKDLITQLEKDLDIIVNCYVVENSTKSYESLLVPHYNKDRIDFFEFHGGSQGNIQDAMNKITALSNTGGITFTDQEWLLNACINAGPGMIGKNNKTNLEDYFSAIAAVLLFDNQIEIINEAFTQGPQLMGSDVKQIHLFSLNSGTYPLSYVLKLTREHLYKVYIQGLSEINNGAQTTIKGFVSHPATFKPGTNKTMKPANWSELSSEALSSVKIEVTFLAGFLSLLQSFLHINN